MRRKLRRWGDLAQTTLAKGWAARQQFAPGTNLKAWLFQIARNQFLSDKRRDWRRQPLDPEVAERTLVACTNPDGNLELDELRRGLAMLAVEQRDALILVGAGGLSCDEAALVMGTAVGTVKSRVSRARRSAIFIEDQTAPKRCGHMAGKTVVPLSEMVDKVRAAVAARQERSTFILARTDAIQHEGVEAAISRAYLEAGADGAYVEGPRTVGELDRIGRELKGAPLAVSVLERGGVTPWVSPKELHAMGYSMILYPTTVLFRVAWATEQALDQLRAERQLAPDQSLDMEAFEKIVELPKWAQIEERFGAAAPPKTQES